jgi:hypothetical protein
MVRLTGVSKRFIKGKQIGIWVDGNMRDFVERYLVSGLPAFGCCVAIRV